MRVSCSFPFAESNDVETGLESMIVKSVSFGDNVSRTPARSVSFNDKTSVPTTLKSLGSGKMVVEKSVSFKGRQFEGMISINKSPDKQDHFIVSTNDTNELQVPDTENPKHEAAIKLQKVYKSFRTRRKLADCAVLVEQSWWKLLDFAELKRSSISFFDIEKHETAISRWSRARTRAAKVGKGLSKNAKAQKLALQHWLEAIDPRHRYGHNLHFYYNKWLQCQSREPFFYWLDIGEGREVNLIEKCPRWKLQQQCIKYLGPKERERFEVIVADGKFYYKHCGEVLHTGDEDDDAKWIFVLSTSKVLYVGKKKKGSFQHSSFLAGGATVAAGRLVVENGVLKAVWPHSGHYQPTEDNFKDFISFLNENKVDLSDVKTSSTDTDEYSSHKQRSAHARNGSFEDDFTESSDSIETEKNTTLTEHDTGVEDLDKEEENEEREALKISEEAILKRINSKNGTKSFQLGRQLSCKWTTGAGPRIGCVRDYPSELQYRALEQVNLSPRSVSVSSTVSSPQMQNSQLWRGTSLPADLIYHE